MNKQSLVEISIELRATAGEKKTIHTNGVVVTLADLENEELFRSMASSLMRDFLRFAKRELREDYEQNQDTP